METDASIYLKLSRFLNSDDSNSAKSLVRLGIGILVVASVRSAKLHLTYISSTFLKNSTL